VFRPGTDRAAYVATMRRDVAAALRYLRGREDIDGERIAVVGSSVGGNVAIAASGLRGGSRATVAVSPVAGAGEPRSRPAPAAPPRPGDRRSRGRAAPPGRWCAASIAPSASRWPSAKVTE